MQLKQKVADAFLERFQLKPNEVEALRGSRNEPITEVRTVGSLVHEKIFIHDIF